MNQKKVWIEKTLVEMKKSFACIANLSPHPQYKQYYAATCIITNNLPPFAYYSIMFLINKTEKPVFFIVVSR